MIIIDVNYPLLHVSTTIVSFSWKGNTISWKTKTDQTGNETLGCVACSKLTDFYIVIGKKCINVFIKLLINTFVQFQGVCYVDLDC